MIGLADIIGRQIVAVTIKQDEKPPRMQLFLTLDDGRYFEIWTHEDAMGFGAMSYSGGLGRVQEEGRDSTETVFEVVAAENGQPKQTVATERSGRIEQRKSRRGSP